MLVLISCNRQEGTTVYYNTSSQVLSYGVERLSGLIDVSGHALNGKVDVANSDGLFILTPSSELNPALSELLNRHLPGIMDGGYKIVEEGSSLYVIGATDRGCLYGLMDVMEQMGGKGEDGTAYDFSNVQERGVNPAHAFRAIKFNLPWSPYRPGEATELHYDKCRDLDFWEDFLDMMVENRFNALSLWNQHPFPYLIRSENYPEACPFNDAELAEWKGFWKALFRMAKDRGIETYLVNWNIVVSPEFAEAYGAKVHFDRSELVKDYTRESVTQLINEYEDLTGLGVTLADWMGNWGEEKMSPREREDWIDETFVEGMKAADREVKFIHRAVLAGDPAEMRRVIDGAGLSDKTIVEVKFNWSHGHSTPKLSITHSNDEGSIARGFWDPEPLNYFIAWMIRNEDFFILRWGDPSFIREHIAANRHNFVEGYFVGSEGYIPAVDISYRDGNEPPWKHAFEKQWLFYHLWGRLLYDPDETDEALARGFERRYPGIDARAMLKAFSLASRVPLHLASFYKGTWDFTLYSEGFLAPWPSGFDDGKSPFISIEELIRHPSLDPSYLSIADYCRMVGEGVDPDASILTPSDLALLLEKECRQALYMIDSCDFTGFLSGKNSAMAAPDSDAAISLESELADIRTWCNLGFYFADKLRAGLALESYRLSGRSEQKEEAIARLEACVDWWGNVVQLTSERYQPVPYVSMGHHEQRWPGFTRFHWSLFTDQVVADLDYARKQ